MRRGRVPDNLNAYASALDGFSHAAIDAACSSFERARRQEGETAFPELGAMLDACRMNSRPDPKTTWTVSNYRECRDFDAWLEEEMAERECSRKDAIAGYLDVKNVAQKAVRESVVFAWTAWRNQMDSRTINCPAWCKACSGDRYRIVESHGRRRAVRCTACCSTA